jgi:hypothetical protein
MTLDSRASVHLKLADASEGEHLAYLKLACPRRKIQVHGIFEVQPGDGGYRPSLKLVAGNTHLGRLEAKDADHVFTWALPDPAAVPALRTEGILRLESKAGEASPDVLDEEDREEAFLERWDTREWDREAAEIAQSLSQERAAAERRRAWAALTPEERAHLEAEAAEQEAREEALMQAEIRATGEALMQQIEANRTRPAGAAEPAACCAIL